MINSRKRGGIYADLVVFLLVIAGLVPGMNMLLQYFLFDNYSIFFSRRVWLPFLASAVIGIAWFANRQATRTVSKVLFPRNRLGLLSLILTCSYFSQVFFGFWHSGIGGWTFEDSGIQRIRVETPAQENLIAANVNHIPAIAAAFRPFARSPERQFTALSDSICWKQDAIIVDAILREIKKHSTFSLLVTPESLGFVFPEYIHRNEPGVIHAILNAQLAGHRSSIWSGLGKVSWIKWRYWSHTPAVSGYFDFSEIESFEKVWLYSVTTCLMSDNSIWIADIQPLNI
jgi:hypothetical protein